MNRIPTIFFRVVLFLWCVEPAQAQQPVDTSFLTNGLVAYYQMNGDAIDQIAGNNGVLLQGQRFTADRFGETNKACTFDGLGGFVETPRPLPDLTSLSFSIWVRPPELGGDRYMFFEGDSAGGKDLSFLFTGNSKVYFLTKTGSSVSILNWLPDTNRWVHFVGIADSTLGKLQLWMNGQLASEESFAGPANVGNHYKLQVGRRADGVVSDSFFKGAIDDFRIYNRALSPDEVRTLNRIERPDLPFLSLGVKTVRVTMYVRPSKTYVLESSFDLVHWNPVASPFVAVAPELVQDFEVSTSGKYFRLSLIQ